nr:MurR/RpiR family transcriptional regulator [Roseburia sp. 1XD42-34]
MINTDLFLLIESSRLKFTVVDEQICAYFLEGNPPLKQSSIAHKINVSTASITRFCQKIGFENYKEFIFTYRNTLEELTIDKNNVTHNLKFRYKELINNIDENLDIQDIQTVCEYIYRHKIIHVYGLGLSAIAGADFKFRFTRIGKFVEVVQDHNSIEMISSLLNKDNLVIYLSLRAKNQYVLDSLLQLQQQGTSIIMITSNQSPEIRKLANVTLLTSTLKNTNEVGQISVQIPLLIIIDMIYSQYISMYRENISKWIHTEHAYLQGHNM